MKVFFTVNSLVAYDLEGLGAAARYQNQVQKTYFLKEFSSDKKKTFTSDHLFDNILSC
jgi:hypothetical protein